MDISKYLDVVDSVQLQETMTTVHFLDINSDGLKATIIEHCSIWQQKLTALLLRMTDAMVDHVYHYIAENSAKLVVRTNMIQNEKKIAFRIGEKKFDVKRGLQKNVLTLEFLSLYLHLIDGFFLK